ncbi:PTS sugar transporter subunit IIC [Clostridium beijerinckii]|uniref:Permease IIC component n=1 Tax=Clostridium beijerinckii TaxID=1520 RepID=A0A1B9BNF6_CLOBE|nr:PTS sugar transporter subunit IIC [Clostridium beijerinckii]AQS03556.1 lichenan permease IIC component [Clostridium beijerinckii]MBA2884813.1 PTS system cellobiose-specific IIC component [Clostridium beijerinckii]MBA2899535.1 PTS system cellobiose-specific IIC component [Clostridium beijerinckii]MBA2909164.1 PTS system cellobiose-specific IIC component [Clostridium beijerinckii]MBA9016901.1 PTS system cellobiose-specific IIC component [Clostridium beijerinckii]
MERFMDFFQEKMIPPLVKVGNQRHLMAIRNGLAITIPFIIVGSIFLILGNLPFDWWADYIGELGPKMNVVVNSSFGVLGVLAALGIGYHLAKSYKLDPITGSVISFVAFLLTQVTEDFQLDTSKFGAEGLFTAIIVCMFAVEVLRFFVKRNIVIKLPEGVPPAVGNSFIALIPALVVMITVWLIRVVIGFNITDFITMIFSPVVFALNTLPGILIYSALVTLLWSAGIHGDMTLEGIADPIYIQFLTVNTAAFIAHEKIPYITASGFYSLFVNVGGTGATLCLVLLMIRSKSKLYKSLGKVSFPSACFEINEPVIFGFPVVLNPVILVPFTVVPLVLTTLSYLMMYFDIIGRPVAMVPWTMPPIIGPFIATGGDWRAAVWSAVEMVIAAIIYYPFFKFAEKQQLEIEGKEENLNTVQA